MIDDKDIEIAKLRGQVEALEKLVKQMMVAPTLPQIIPMPYPVPTIQPQRPWIHPYDYTGPFWTITGTTTGLGYDPTVTCTTTTLCPDVNLYFTNAPGITS